MSYNPTVQLYTDAFGRLRTSGTGQRLDVEFLYDKQPDFFDETTNGGSASVTHNANPRDLTLTVGTTTDGEYAAMHSYPVPYTPGNSQLIDITGVFDLAGIGGGTAEVFLRTKISGTVAEETVTQANWNKLTGASDVDWTTSLICAMDFQSLKVGTIRYFLVMDGVPIHVASIHNSNERDSGYWQLANLPAYWKIYNDATDTIIEMGYGNDDNGIGFRYKFTADATATMKAICATVKSEGGIDLKELPGIARTADSGTTAVTASTTLVPILSIRPRTTFNSLDNLIITLPKSFNFETDNPVRMAIVHGGTLTGASWSNVDTNNSSVEYDVAASAISGGVEVYSEYITTSARNRANSSQGLLGKTVLWDRQSSHTGIFTICAVRTTGTDGSCLASLQWEEIK